MYKIILPFFEGPLDLLIYFIKRDQLDLFDIPISKITEEFLAYIKLMKSLDIEVTSKFIVMAATLMQIKSQMLLPRKENNSNSEDIPDPRNELVEQIIAHEKIASIRQNISELIENHNHLYFRGITENQLKDFSKKYISYNHLQIIDLINSLKKLFNNKKDEYFSEIKVSRLNIEEEIHRIENIIVSEGQITFSKLTQNFEKPYLIITFIAILELIKQKKAIALQNNEFDDFVLFSTNSTN